MTVLAIATVLMIAFAFVVFAAGVGVGIFFLVRASGRRSSAQLPEHPSPDGTQAPPRV
jgi:hypothetical protein